MLWLGVELPKFATDKKQISGFMILKAREYSLGMVNRGIKEQTFMKITIVLFGKKK